MKTNKTISVVMATYNGSKYIKEQISSICSQLNEYDEIIIVDDCSSDNTVEIINSYNDDRVKVFINSTNIGVIKSFELGIIKTKNEFIFLSDQDDIWRDDKVRVIMTAFENNPSVTLICSDATVVDSDKVIINKSYMDFKNYKKVSFINALIRNPVLGCTIAFTAQIKTRITPFPKKIPMHDMWIVLIEFIYGRVLFIDKPLIFYRRHLSNVTGIKRSNLKQILVWRYNLVICLLGKIFGFI